MILKIIKSKYQQTPPITRSLFTLIFFTSILHYIKYISPSQICFSLHHIIYRFQLYRLILPLCTFSINSLDSILSLFFCYKYCGMIESLLVRRQFLCLLASIVVLLNGLSIFWDINISASFSCSITYIWTRFNPSTQVALMGFVVFPSFYLPFLIPSLVFIMEGRVPYDELAGIFSGHVVYFGWVLLPRLRVFSVAGRPHTRVQVPLINEDGVNDEDIDSGIGEMSDFSDSLNDNTRENNLNPSIDEENNLNSSNDEENSEEAMEEYSNTQSSDE